MGVTVALPVYRASGTLARALECIAAQTLADLEVIIILNGSDEATRRVAHAFARRRPPPHSRTRVIELPEANLAAAMNVALEAARHELVARMDADDECMTERLALQAGHMQRHTELAALGTAWELVDEAGATISTVRPPTDPAHLRWRLMLGNCLAHGSMMLRRSAVLGAGGYDAGLSRAQDFALWLRLMDGGCRIACLPDVLYRHRTRHPEDPSRSTPEQAEVVAPLLLRAWSALPDCPGGAEREALIGGIAAAVAGGGGAGIERLLTERGATREGLLAWVWAQWSAPGASRRAVEAGRRSRLREVGAQLRRAGASRVHLWGAGDHTRWVLDHVSDLGLEIAGIVDDRLAGTECFGMTVMAPGELGGGIHRSESGATGAEDQSRPNPARSGGPPKCGGTGSEHVLISSDWHEEAIWKSSEACRRRGVRVWRLYGEQAAGSE